jgi:hypothetical protein
MTFLSAVALAALIGCSSASPDGTVASPTPEPPLPSNATLKAAFLTGPEIGAGFTGGPPTSGTPSGVTIGKPVCGLGSPKDRRIFKASFGSADGKTAVFETIRVLTAVNAEAFMDVIRDRANAMCSFKEKVGTTKYRVKVDGPIELPDVADDEAGYSETYTGGYKGERWDMFARIGRITVLVELTAPTIDEAFAIALFRKAVEKAADIE